MLQLPFELVYHAVMPARLSVCRIILRPRVSREIISETRSPLVGMYVQNLTWAVRHALVMLLLMCSCMDMLSPQAWCLLSALKVCSHSSAGKSVPISKEHFHLQWQQTATIQGIQAIMTGSDKLYDLDQEIWTYIESRARQHNLVN